MYRSGLLKASRVPLLKASLKPLRPYSTRAWGTTGRFNKPAFLLASVVTLGAVYVTSNSFLASDADKKKEKKVREVAQEAKEPQETELIEETKEPEETAAPTQTEKPEETGDRLEAKETKETELAEQVKQTQKADETKENEASDSKSENGDNEEEPKREAAYDPETGEINWDCPCLGGMAHGPCGEEFKEAFSCFVYSEADPKGIDCVEKFRGMQECFRKYPEHYAEQIKDEEEAAQSAAEMESTNNQEETVPEAQMTTPETSSDVKQEEATFEPIIEEHREEQADKNEK